VASLANSSAAGPASRPAAAANAAGPDEFHRFMRAWATGIAVVTGHGAARPVGCTVTAVMSVSLRPPLLLVSLANESRTLAAIRYQGSFGVSLLAGDQAHLAEHFATAPGDRFARVPHHVVDGVPVLDEALATAACHVERVIAAADHTLVLGRPHWYGECGAEVPLVRFDGVSAPLPAG
jgi:3-hydroxy-9,10-secoandrosta-1,3,5(10)-triene-9,17-dione monooxygenase reductase component